MGSDVWGEGTATGHSPVPRWYRGISRYAAGRVPGFFGRASSLRVGRGASGVGEGAMLPHGGQFRHAWASEEDNEKASGGASGNAVRADPRSGRCPPGTVPALGSQKEGGCCSALGRTTRCRCSASGVQLHRENGSGRRADANRILWSRDRLSHGWEGQPHIGCGVMGATARGEPSGERTGEKGYGSRNEGGLPQPDSATAVALTSSRRRRTSGQFCCSFGCDPRLPRHLRGAVGVPAAPTLGL